MSVYVSPTSMMTAVAPHWESDRLRLLYLLSPRPGGALGWPAQVQTPVSPALPSPGPGLTPATTQAAACPGFLPPVWS